MDKKILEQLLEEVRAGRLPVASALERLRTLPFEDLGFARVDHHRQLRQSFPEVVFAAGKSLEQLRGILASLNARSDQILVTRLAPDKAAALADDFPEARYYPDSQAWTFSRGEIPDRGRGLILVISAGTSDIPVSEEALVTARIMGHRAEALYDVGVAGLHRLLAHQDLLAQATCCHRGGGHGRRAPQRGGGAGGPAGGGGAHQYRLRRLLRRPGRAVSHAQFLRHRPGGGEHRQRLRRRLPGGHD